MVVWPGLFIWRSTASNRSRTPPVEHPDLVLICCKGQWHACGSQIRGATETFRINGSFWIIAFGILLGIFVDNTMLRWDLTAPSLHIVVARPTDWVAALCILQMIRKELIPNHAAHLWGENCAFRLFVGRWARMTENILRYITYYHIMILYIIMM